MTHPSTPPVPAGNGAPAPVAATVAPPAPGAIPEHLLAARVPRYTSVPPANRFTDAVGPEVMAEWLRALDPAIPASLYLHLPFCRRLCYFCACRTQGTRSDAPLDRYLDHLGTEIGTVAAHLPQGLRFGALHLGGGTPTILSPDRLERLGAMLRRHVEFTPGAEIAVEIDPTDCDGARLDALMALGMTRASIGVQDFAPQVQAAIGRRQGAALTADLVRDLRDRGIGSLNMDLVYGLPHQDAASLRATLAAVIDLAPDRLALFGYAHVPWMATRQKLIPERALPGPAARRQLYDLAAEMLVAAGYQPIGIDHFARPGDSLAQAAREGRLRRNFQGYTTDAAPALIGLGASAISRLPQGYAQNIAATGAWQDRVRPGRLGTARGHCLTPQDMGLSAAIEGLMCRGEADIAAACAGAGIAPEPMAARAARAAAELAPWAEWDGTRLRVGDMALARLAAARLDGIGAHADGQGRYSLAG